MLIPALLEGWLFLLEYLTEHTITCLVPALFLAGAISSFLSQAAVLRYFAGGVSPFLSYGVASVSGTMLAVCSCTVLPLFSGIWRRGAGIGPAIAFLFSGPAINVLAIALTARVLGFELGVARFIFAVVLAIVIGFVMAQLFRQKPDEALVIESERQRPLWQDLLFFGALVSLLIFASTLESTGRLLWMGSILLHVVAVAALAFAFYSSDERRLWLSETWYFTRLIVPWLIVGVFVAGVLLGRPSQGDVGGLIPSQLVVALVGDESALSTVAAAFLGLFFYFATLTEVPILEALLASGMGLGPALALLLAGPAISLPSLLALRSVMGWKMSGAYAVLVLIFSVLAGLLFSYLFV